MRTLLLSGVLLAATAARAQAPQPLSCRQIAAHATAELSTGALGEVPANPDEKRVFGEFQRGVVEECEAVEGDKCYTRQSGETAIAPTGCPAHPLKGWMATIAGQILPTQTRLNRATQALERVLGLPPRAVTPATPSKAAEPGKPPPAAQPPAESARPPPAVQPPAPAATAREAEPARPPPSPLAASRGESAEPGPLPPAATGPGPGWAVPEWGAEDPGPPPPTPPPEPPPSAAAAPPTAVEAPPAPRRRAQPQQPRAEDAPAAEGDELLALPLSSLSRRGLRYTATLLEDQKPGFGLVFGMYGGAVGGIAVGAFFLATSIGYYYVSTFGLVLAVVGFTAGAAMAVIGTLALVSRLRKRTAYNARLEEIRELLKGSRQPASKAELFPLPPMLTVARW